jgi:uroporphyrinogen-III synthase
MKKILITRPDTESEIMAQELRDMGFKTLIAPMLDVQVISFEMPPAQEAQVLLFTSANAARIMAEHLPEGSAYFDQSVLCVGEKTKQTLQSGGFKHIKSAEGDVQDMIEMIVAAHEPQKTYLHVRGSHASKPLHVWLAGRGIAVDILPVYKAQEIDTLPDDVIAAFRNGDIHASIHMSPRSAQAYVKVIEKHGLESAHDSIKSLSISPAVVKCLHSLPWAETYSAEAPTKASLYKLLREECRF